MRKKMSSQAVQEEYQVGKESVVDIADDIFRVISYKEAAILVSNEIYEKSGIKYGFLPSRGKQNLSEVILRSSDRAIQLYDSVCKENHIERLKSPVSTQVIRKLHLLAFGENFIKKARQRDGDYLASAVKLQAPIRAYKALYKVTTQDVPVEFCELIGDLEIDEKHDQEKNTNSIVLHTNTDTDFLYPKYDILLEGIKIGTVYKQIYYVFDKNDRQRKKSTLKAKIKINIDGNHIVLNSPSKKVLSNIRQWIITKLRNCLKNKIAPAIEYKCDNRGVVFASMPMLTKLAQMNDLLARSPAGRDIDLVNWIDRQELNDMQIPCFPNRELLSNLIIGQN